MPSLFQKIQSKYFRKSVLNLIQFKPAANVNFVAEHMMNSHNTTSFINRVINAIRRTIPNSKSQRKPRLLFKTTTAFRHITEGSYAFVKFFNQSSCCFRQTLFVCNKVKYVRKILLSGYGNFNAENHLPVLSLSFAKPLPLREPVLPQCHENFFPSESQTLLCSSAKHLNVSASSERTAEPFHQQLVLKKYGWHDMVKPMDSRTSFASCFNCSLIRTRITSLARACITSPLEKYVFTL